MFLPGATTSGHYQIELSCSSCHTPYQPVASEACMKCHEKDLKLGEDSHPKAKFTDPRNADRIERLDATSCIACHVEHRPEMTRPMGVTLPDDYCFLCHADVAKERPSHEGMGFQTCASAGCHRFHDNRALYADFLVKHNGEPDVLDLPSVVRRSVLEGQRAKAPAGAPDHPESTKVAAANLALWSVASHAQSGVNCTGCHRTEDAGGGAAWMDRPGYAVCQSCHADEAAGFLEGKHGMRLAASLPPMSTALARQPMAPEGARNLGCGSCHSAHEFDTRNAAADACLVCHADKHSLSYKASPHFALWQAELDGTGAAGTGVSCATCHLPRLTGGEGDTHVVKVQHNQNANLRPNEKMIREVCMSCHGLGFSIDALADSSLIQANFRGRPSRHLESIEMAVRKAARK